MQSKTDFLIPVKKVSWTDGKFICPETLHVASDKELSVNIRQELHRIFPDAELLQTENLSAADLQVFYNFPLPGKCNEQYRLEIKKGHIRFFRQPLFDLF